MPATVVTVEQRGRRRDGESRDDESRFAQGLDLPLVGASVWGFRFYEEDYQPSRSILQFLEALPPKDFPPLLINRMVDEATSRGFGEHPELTLFAYTYELKENEESLPHQIYGDCNKAMRDNCREGLNLWREFIWFLDQALLDPRFKGNKAPAAILWRGVKLRFPLDRYAKDKIVTWPSFSSTSTSTAVAKGFGDGVGTRFRLLDCGGAAMDIAKYSKFPEEEEWLLPSNSRFMVKDVVALAPGEHEIVLVSMPRYMPDYVDWGCCCCGGRNTVFHSQYFLLLLAAAFLSGPAGLVWLFVWSVLSLCQAGLADGLADESPEEHMKICVAVQKKTLVVMLLLCLPFGLLCIPLFLVSMRMSRNWTENAAMVRGGGIRQSEAFQTRMHLGTFLGASIGAVLWTLVFMTWPTHGGWTPLGIGFFTIGCVAAFCCLCCGACQWALLRGDSKSVKEQIAESV